MPVKSIKLKDMQKGDRIFSRPIMCDSCGHVGPLKLTYLEKPWHCVRCGAGYDMSHAVIEASYGQHYIEEAMAVDITRRTIIFAAAAGVDASNNG